MSKRWHNLFYILSRARHRHRRDAGSDADAGESRPRRLSHRLGRRVRALSDGGGHRRDRHQKRPTHGRAPAARSDLRAVYVGFGKSSLSSHAGKRKHDADDGRRRDVYDRVQLFRRLDDIRQHPDDGRKQQPLPEKQIREPAAGLKGALLDQRDAHDGKARRRNQRSGRRAQPVKRMVDEPVFPELFQAGRDDEDADDRGRHETQRRDERAGDAGRDVAHIGRRVDADRLLLH